MEKIEKKMAAYLAQRNYSTRNDLYLCMLEKLIIWIKSVLKKLGKWETEGEILSLSSDYIFLYEGEPIQDVKSSFKGALRRAGIEDFCFHDLRHTFASLVIMRGGSLRDVQSLLGHKSLAMTLRYSHLTSDHRLKAVNLLNGVTCHKVDTNVLSVKSASM